MGAGDDGSRSDVEGDQWRAALVPGGRDPRLVARTLRRWRERYEAHGYGGLLDKRRLRPSGRRLPPGEVEAVLRLYRERYSGFNVRHFHDIVRREHGVTLSYRAAKHALQGAGLVKKHRARGRHRRRREPRACFGELLHLDGGTPAWLALSPTERPCLIAVSDDATKRVLHAALYPSESLQAVMTSLAAVLRTDGLPMALSTDRAGWAFHTPKAKGPVDKTHLTQVGRALTRLGIEHIPSYSPQARGRSERLNRTFQDRVVNELRVAGIATSEAANRYLVEHYLPQHNATFAVPPRDAESAFVPLGDADLDAILCVEVERVVARVNTVSVGNRVLQLAKQAGRRSCAGLQVIVRQHLDGRLTVSQGARRLGVFTAAGLWTLPRLWTAGTNAGRPQVAWTAGPERRRPTSAHRRSCYESGQIICQTKADRSLVSNTAPPAATRQAGLPLDRLPVNMLGAPTRARRNRFLEWHEGDKVWNSAIYTLTFEPGVYQRHKPEVFEHDVLEASIIFDKIIRDTLRELYKVNDHIAALSSDAAAAAITKVDTGEKGQLSKRIKTFDENADVVVKWGCRAITALPHIHRLLEMFRSAG